MTSPAERLIRTLEPMATAIAQLMGMHPEVVLTYTDHQWECTKAAPDIWIGEPFLSSLLSPPWSRAGDCVKLDVTNGSWIWKLTGETTTGSNIDGALTMHRAVWPD